MDEGSVTFKYDDADHVDVGQYVPATGRSTESWSSTTTTHRARNPRNPLTTKYAATATFNAR